MKGTQTHGSLDILSKQKNLFSISTVIMWYFSLSTNKGFHETRTFWHIFCVLFLYNCYCRGLFTIYICCLIIFLPYVFSYFIYLIYQSHKLGLQYCHSSNWLRGHNGQNCCEEGTKIKFLAEKNLKLLSEILSSTINSTSKTLEAMEEENGYWTRHGKRKNISKCCNIYM